MSYSFIKPYTNKRGVTHMAHYAGAKYIGTVSKLGDEPIVLNSPVVLAQVVTEIPIAVRVEDEIPIAVRVEDEEDELIVSDDEELVVSDDEELVVSDDEELVVSDDEDDEELVVSDDEDDELIVSDDEDDELIVSDDEDEEFDETTYKSYISTKTYDEKMDMYWDMMDDETKTNERRIILGMVM